MTDAETLIANCLTEAEFPELPNFYRGKVRDTYALDDGRSVFITTDRQSAFDQVLAAVPFKGQVLNQTARFWFDRTRDICPNHVIDDPDPNVAIVRRLEMLPVEMVARSYLTGSTDTAIWPMYERGGRVLYGHPFPDGMKKNQRLDETILTPTTKGAAGTHDVPITPADAVAQGLVSQAQWDELADRSLALFARGQEIAARNGLVLVDTKYEFGVDENGVITLADEVHTPDSSRYWIAETYESRFAAGENPDSLDKEFLRLWVSERCDPYSEPIPEIPAETLMEFSGRYIALYERVTGSAFGRPRADQPVKERLRAALARALPEYF